VPAKILGVLLIVGGWLLQRESRKARERGYVGPADRRIHRAEQKWRFRLALVSQAFGALICFLSAFLCLTAGLHH
jgi:hypothetical protein